MSWARVGLEQGKAMGEVKVVIGDKKKHANKTALIYQRLKRCYPDARIELNFTNPVELFVATILSAQCTDKRVNQITPALFARFKQPADYLQASPAELEAAIHSAGFFRQKAKFIRGAMQRIITEHAGEVPHSMEELICLPGVGRKTANVILANAFGIPGIAVDTHVIRLTRLIGLTKHLEPEAIEQDLQKLYPRKHWTMLSHLLIFHGRRVCKARRPNCAVCCIRDLCHYGQKQLA